jgi:hypothetical protein
VVRVQVPRAAPDVAHGEPDRPREHHPRRHDGAEQPPGEDDYRIAGSFGRTPLAPRAPPPAAAGSASLFARTTGASAPAATGSAQVAGPGRCAAGPRCAVGPRGAVRGTPPAPRAAAACGTTRPPAASSSRGPPAGRRGRRGREYHRKRLVAGELVADGVRPPAARASRAPGHTSSHGINVVRTPPVPKHQASRRVATTRARCGSRISYKKSYRCMQPGPMRSEGASRGHRATRTDAGSHRTG